MAEFSKIPIGQIKANWCAALRALPALSAVTIHPAWPGQGLLYAQEQSEAVYKSVIWFGPSWAQYERHSMRAGKQRRIDSHTFHVIIEVLVAGESNDSTMTSDGWNAALRAEDHAYTLWEPIDSHIAEEKHLSSPEFVDSAVVDGEPGDAGFTDTGYGYRLSMPIIVKFRLL